MIEYKKQVKVSVIVPHYSALSALDNCLSRLQQQSFSADEMEIIVADNCSPEGATAVAKVIKDRGRLIEVSERGAGPARNGGVVASRGEFLAFVDSDCQADADWVSAGIRALTDFDFVGGRVDVLGGGPNSNNPRGSLREGFRVRYCSLCQTKGFRGCGKFILFSGGLR